MSNPVETLINNTSGDNAAYMTEQLGPYKWRALCDATLAAFGDKAEDVLRSKVVRHADDNSSFHGFSTESLVRFVIDNGLSYID